MRVLICPTYEFASNPKADSSYILSVALFEFLNQQPDCYAYLIVPKGSAEQHEKGLMIETDTHKTRDENEVLQYEALKQFNPVNGVYPIDVVITNNAGKATQLIDYFSLTGAERVNIPVLIWDFCTKFRGQGQEIQNITEENLGYHAMSYALSAQNIFFSEFQKTKALELVRTYCSPAYCYNAELGSMVIPISFDSSRIKPYIVEKDKKMSFYFGGRFTATKGGEIVAEQYDYLYSFGRDVKIKITTPSKSNRRLNKFLNKKGQEIEMYYGLSQGEAWKVMSSCHVFMYYQSLKMFPAAPWEQLYAGLVGIFKDYGHEKQILPPDYPYLYTTKQEAATIIRYVLNNYEEAKAKIAYVPEWIEKHVERKAGFSRILEVLKGMVTHKYKDKAIVQQSMIGEESIGWLELIERIRNRADHKQLVFGEPGRQSGMYYGELYQRHIPVDYCDSCENELPFYKKVKR